MEIGLGTDGCLACGRVLLLSRLADAQNREVDIMCVRFPIFVRKNTKLNVCHFRCRLNERESAAESGANWTHISHIDAVVEYMIGKYCVGQTN